MTNEFKKSVLHRAVQQSKDGRLYVVLLDDHVALVVCGENKAAELAKLFGYRIYAKCKDGGLVL